MSAPACLLCDAESPRALSSLTGGELRLLFAVTGRQLSEVAYGRITEDFAVILYECRACGFQYFDPKLAGSGLFYSELEQAPYYPSDRPEFLAALQFCRNQGLTKILDVGGGDGAFLDLAKGAGMETTGIELNPKAAKAARAKGHRMLEQSFAEISPDELKGGVQFMTFFQVIEHLADPRCFLREAQRFVMPGGYLMFSVPNRSGIFRLLPYDPANLPPHHISRWRHKDIVLLSNACGLEVIQLGTDVLYGRGIESFWTLNNAFAKAIERPLYPGSVWLPKLISFLYRKLGCRFYFPRMGMSIFAIVRRPA